MENPLRLAFFGDSIIKGCAPWFTNQFSLRFPNVDLVSLNAGVSGETSRDGLARLQELADWRPTVVVLGFGMNDWRKGVSQTEFRKNLEKLIDTLEHVGARVIPCTISPSYEGLRLGTNPEGDEYSEIVRDVALKRRLKIADVNAAWKRKIRPAWRGLRDALHPNKRGYALFCEALAHVVGHPSTTILWQYNGREARCNYRCPYCYYTRLWKPQDMFFGTMDQWHTGFKASFGKQPLYFYLGFGEPMLGGAFPDILDMVVKEPNWQLRVISNISLPLENVLSTPLARSGRLHINASFHPLSTTIDAFLKKLFQLREHGIEAPVVYVAWPQFMSRLEADIERFAKHSFIVHLRRFQGLFKGREYPYAYTDDQARLIARYMDEGSLLYMLRGRSHRGMESSSGFHFFVVDNVGNVGYDSNLFPEYSRYRCIFGNIHQGNFRPLFLPGPYPGGREGTVDGVANLVDAGYRELQGNHVMSFCEQGGLRVENGQVIYPHRFTDFTNREVRAHYGFPPRDLLDLAWLGPSEGMHTLLSTLRGSAHRRRLGAKAAQVAQQLGVHVKRSPRGRNLS